ncbi:putative RNA-directed DNA polymerase [Helianthus annuus]|nr:putative RNA-directed DNA polymerase [Helianthus annuus]KAJ0883937.1 putative RNA-directed DNA polymerase [Helianthus annuus]
MIESFLTSHNLFGYVNGTIPCPKQKVTVEAATTDNPSYVPWISNDAHIRTLIISTVSEESYQHVQGKTSREVWLSLERAYAPVTASHEFTLRSQLLRITMKGDEKPIDYLCRVQEYATALANIGEPVKDKELVMLTLAGLREEYNGLKGTLLGRLPPVSFHEIYSLLSDHDYVVTKLVQNNPQAFLAATSNPSAGPGLLPNPPSLDQLQQQLQNIQLMASQLGFQLNPNLSPRPQANFGARSYNNNRGTRNNRGYSRGNSRGSFTSRPRDNGGTRQFQWASTQNTVYGHCNRCGIAHLPSLCPNQPSQQNRPPPQANYSAFSDAASSSGTSWKTDTGATHHATPDLTSLDNSEAYYGNDSLLVGNGNSIPILHIGSSKFHSTLKTFKLSDILHVPALKQNLLSVQKFCLDNNVFFEFHSSYFVVKDESTRSTLLTGPSEHGLYSIRLPQLKSLPKVAFTAVKASSNIWHQRLGHPHAQVFNSIVSYCSLPISDKLSNNLCSSCQLGKSTKLHLSDSSFRSSNILDLVYCDVWGPSPEPSIDGHRYFLLCVDHCTRYIWFYPLTQKSDAYAILTNFITMAERQFNRKLKCIQSDWGGEFRPLTNLCRNLGIIHRRSCPHTSEQNGFVERRHRHVVETGLSLLAHSTMPQRFWHFAFETAVYLINRLPSRVSSNKSPFEHAFLRKPDYSFLRVFGSQCFPYLRPYNRHKIEFRSTPCVFLGYSLSHHGYRCFDPSTERIYIARHVRFDEQVFPYKPIPQPTPSLPPASPYISIFPNPPPGFLPEPNPTTATDSPPSPPHQPSHVDPTPMTDPPTVHQNPTASPPMAQPCLAQPIHPEQSAAVQQPSQAHQSNDPPPNATRSRPSNLRQKPKPPDRYDPAAYIAKLTSSLPIEPTSFTIANKYSEWRHAMSEELDALHKNGTWTLVPPVPNANIVDCKWVYRLKTDENGKISRFKARLVAKGFHQQHGVDYHETFSPVIKPATIRTILSLAATNKWSLRQLDIQTAFLHGDLAETVYMRQPPGFVDPSKPDHICLLNKSLYGLKQAPRAWFNKLSNALHQLGFHGSKTDPSLFILNSEGSLVYLLVYVDDIIITGNNAETVSKLITRLHSLFALKDLGQLHYFLGVEVIHKKADFVLSQRKYIGDILHRSGLTDCKPISTPMSTSHVLLPDDSPPLDDPSRYRQTVGALQYVTLTRPDIAFAVNRVCQFMHAPTENHWAAVKRILRYLKGTMNMGLWFRHNTGYRLQAFSDSHWSTNVQAFSDSDWAGCPIDCRSTGGFAIYLGSNLISWSARKQRTVSRSSTESEYKAIADTVAELIWLKSLLQELGLHDAAPTLWCDNLGATYLTANPVFHARTKQIEVDFNFVREQVARGHLNVKFISTDDQIADIFTKPLSSQKFEFLRSKLQIANRPELAGEY